MRRIILILLALSLLIGLPLSRAYAGDYLFSPVPADLDDLNHYFAYSWGLGWAVPAGEYITSARLSFEDIYNWGSEPSDRLYVRLLNDTAAGVNSYWDWQNSTDYFSGLGTPLFTYTDLDDNASTEDLSYNFTAAQINTLTNYASNGNFGLSFDPDCHYYNKGVEFNVQTAVIPEPVTMSLLGIGLLGLAGLRRKKGK